METDSLRTQLARIGEAIFGEGNGRHSSPLARNLISHARRVAE
jgi:hypothetical protein